MSISFLAHLHRCCRLLWRVVPLPAALHPSALTDLAPFCSALLDELQFHLGGVPHDAHYQLHQFLRHGGGVQSSIQGLDRHPAFDQTIDLDKHFDH